MKGINMSCCGLKTEVFSRIVGYIRPIVNWNKGKNEEFKDRIPYKVNSSESLLNNETLLCTECSWVGYGKKTLIKICPKCNCKIETSIERMERKKNNGME